MLKQVKISTKLLIVFLLISVVPFSVIGMIAWINAKSSLSDMAYSKLVSMRDVKKTEIINFFRQRTEDMSILLETVKVLRQASSEKLRSVQENKKATVEDFFERCFSNAGQLADNPLTADALRAYASVLNEDGSINAELYNFFEELKYSALKTISKDNQFHDLLLITEGGKVCYSAKRESDLGADVGAGDLKNSALASSFQRGMKHINISDFEPYPPSDNRHISFISVPIIERSVTIGVLAVKLSADPLNKILQRREGMGKTGESYIVGKLNEVVSYRSDRTVRQGKVGDLKNDADIGKALSGESGTLVKIRETGELMLSGYDPISINGLNWALITTMSLEEVIAPRLAGESDDYFTTYVKKYGYNDLMLVHPQGTVFYSVKRKADYGTNLLNGDFSGAGIGRLFRKVITGQNFAFSDVEIYPPADNEPVFFMAQPVLHQQQIELVVMIEIPINSINRVMTERSGMGNTGETYLVGSDMLMRSDSASAEKGYSVRESLSNPEHKRVETEASRLALSGKTGQNRLINYAGREVLSAYTTLPFDDMTWALIAEIDTEEAFSPVKHLNVSLALVAVIAVFAILLTAPPVAAYILKPLKIMAERLKDIAEGEGDLTRRLDVGTNDQIGELAKWFNTFIDSLQNMIRTIASDTEALNNASVRMTELSVRLASGSENMSLQASTVAGATDQIFQSINTMAGAAEEMSVNSQSVSSSADQMSQNMDVITVSVEAMITAIRDVDARAREGAGISVKAMELSQHAADTMNIMGEAAKEIDQVTNVIKRIAEQTNLLALNATIEAASAGDAGRGFSVVANEIKALSNQSARAAEDIAKRIGSAQANTREAVKVMRDISEIINRINDSVAVISKSVEQQTVSSNDISLNVRQAGAGVNHIASAISDVAKGAEDMARSSGDAASAVNNISESMLGVSQSASDTNKEAQQVSSSAEELSRISERLRKMVDAFRV